MKPFEREVKRCSLTVKQALPARATSYIQTDATFLAYNSQHCWMLQVAAVCTPCYMLLRKIETGQILQTTQHCWPITPNTVTSVCTQLYGILENGLLYKTRAYDWGFKPNANGHNNKWWELIMSPFARS